MNKEYHKEAVSQPTKRCYRKKYRRVRKTLNKGFPIPAVPQSRVLHNPKKYIQLLTPSEKAVLSILIEFRKKNWLVYPSQSTIADKAGVCAKTVSRSLLTLERLGLVTNNYRHCRTSLYDITSILWDTNIIRKLKKLLPALLILWPYAVPQASLINNLNVYSNRSTFLHSNIWDSKTRVSTHANGERSNSELESKHNPICPRQVCTRQACLNVNMGENVMNDYNVKIKQAIEKVELIMPLTLNRKAWLTIFPSSFILEASKALMNLLKRSEPPNNPFGYIYRSCMAMCKRENIQVSYKTRLALKKKYNFDEDEAPMTALDLLYKPEKETQTGYSRPKKGIYAIWHRPEWQNQKKGETVHREIYEKPDNFAYDDEASKSLAELCDEWEQKWLKQKEKFGDRISSFDKGMIKTGLVAMLRKHCNIQKANSVEKAVEYLKDVLFNVMAPSSITRGTILSSNEYYSILASKLNKFEKELENEESNHKGSYDTSIYNNNTRKSYTPKKASFMQKKGLRFAGEYKERYILDN